MSWLAPLCTVTAVLLLAARWRPQPHRVRNLVRGGEEPPPPAGPVPPGAPTGQASPSQHERAPPALPGAQRASDRGARPAVHHVTAWVPVVVALLVGGPALAGGVGLARWVVARAVRLRRARERSRVAAARLPLCLDLFVLAVRGGYGPSLAVGAVTPYLPEPYRAAFSEVDRRIRLGERFTDAIGHLPGIVGPVAQPMTDALVTATRYGHPLAPVLDQLSRDARQARRRQADIDARQLPIRLSFPLVACVLPGFALVSVVPLLGGTLSSLRLAG